MPLSPNYDDEETTPDMGGDDVNYKKLLMQQLQAQNQPTPVDPNNNALVSSLNQSFSKLGTLNGRASDTSDVTRYSDILDKAKAARQQQDLAKTGQQSKILQALAQLKDKDMQKQQSLSLMQQQMQNAKDQKLSDQQFQREQQDRLFNQQQSLYDKKAENAQNIAQVRADQKPSAASQAVDKEFGKDYNDFVVKGGYGNVQKGIQQLNNVAQSLGEDNSLTGPIAGRTPNFIRSFTNPKAIDTRQQVEDVVQRSLKEILGAQFTEKEGERILARAYDPTLDAKTNQEKVLRLAKSLKQAAESKLNAAKYYEQNGTLQGFKGTLANGVDDILADIDRPAPSNQGVAQAPSNGDQQLMSVPGAQSAPPMAAPKMNPARLDAQAAGSKRIVAGKTYTKGPDGLWHEE